MRQLDWAVAAISGTFMVGSVVTGLLIGVWIDRNFGTDPVGKGLGIVLGGTAGTVELVRMLLRASERRR